MSEVPLYRGTSLIRNHPPPKTTIGLMWYKFGHVTPHNRGGGSKPSKSSVWLPPKALPGGIQKSIFKHIAGNRGSSRPKVDKSAPMAPRTHLGYPHEVTSVARHTRLLQHPLQMSNMGVFNRVGHVFTRKAGRHVNKHTKITTDSLVINTGTKTGAATGASKPSEV